MNTFRKSILIGLTALGMGVASLGAHAQSPAPGNEGRNGWAANQEAMQAKMAAGMAAHAAKLHDALKLTAAQEPDWTAFQAAVKPAPRTGTRPDRAAIAAMTAPARLEAAIAHMKTRETQMEAHLAALKTFYAVLTPAQQKTFDDNVMGGANAKHHGMGMHRG